MARQSFWLMALLQSCFSRVTKRSHRARIGGEKSVASVGSDNDTSLDSELRNRDADHGRQVRCSEIARILRRDFGPDDR